MQFPEYRRFPNIPGFTVNEKYFLCSTEKLSTHCRGQTVWNNLLSETFWLYKSKNLVFSNCSGLLFYDNFRHHLMDWEEFALHPRGMLEKQVFGPGSLCKQIVLPRIPSLCPVHGKLLFILQGSAQMPPPLASRQISSCSSLLPFATCPHLMVTLLCSHSDLIRNFYSPLNQSLCVWVCGGDGVCVGWVVSMNLIALIPGQGLPQGRDLISEGGIGWAEMLFKWIPNHPDLVTSGAH